MSPTEQEVPLTAVRRMKKNFKKHTARNCCTLLLLLFCLGALIVLITVEAYRKSAATRRAEHLARKKMKFYKELKEQESDPSLNVTWIVSTRFLNTVVG